MFVDMQKPSIGSHRGGLTSGVPVWLPERPHPAFAEATLPRDGQVGEGVSPALDAQTEKHNDLRRSTYSLQRRSQSVPDESSSQQSAAVASASSARRSGGLNTKATSPKGRGYPLRQNQILPRFRGDAMPTSHQAYRHTRLEGLFDHANLLRRGPAPPTLNRRDDLNAIARIGRDRRRQGAGFLGAQFALQDRCQRRGAPDGCAGPRRSRNDGRPRRRDLRLARRDQRFHFTSMLS